MIGLPQGIRVIAYILAYVSKTEQIPSRLKSDIGEFNTEDSNNVKLLISKICTICGSRHLIKDISHIKFNGEMEDIRIEDNYHLDISDLSISILRTDKKVMRQQRF